MIFNRQSKLLAGIVTLITLVSYQEIAYSAVGESAVITLIFPPGARATGLGEAFTGLADDANATFYNPAGLGLSPQANSWKIHLNKTGVTFTSIAAKKRKDFGSKDIIWAGTNKGLLRFNGKVWEDYEIYLIGQNDASKDLKDIASKFIKIDDPLLLKDAIWTILSFNKISQKHYKSIKIQLLDALQKNGNKNAEFLADSLAKEIVMIPSSERSSAKIYALISNTVGSSRASSLSDQLITVFQTKDKVFQNLDEIKIPFSIAVKDSITCLALDNSSRLWAGTVKGLWRYSDNEWNHYTVGDGLPSNVITSIAVSSSGQISIGTYKGIGIYKDGQWKSLDTSHGLPSATINAVAYGNHNELYAGTPAGLLKITDSTITIYDKSTGLLDENVLSLFLDSKEQLWIGHHEGATIYDRKSWRQYSFPNMKVTSFTEHGNGNIWIGTDQGVISYKDRGTYIDENGVTKEKDADWKSFHNKNVLSDNDVRAVIDHDKDIWIAANNAINQYDNANRQVFLFYEQLLPYFKIPDLWHAYASVVYPTQDWGTIGGFVNYINMGENITTDALGREMPPKRSWEGVFGLSYGLALMEDLSVGLNAKYVYSALAPALKDEGVGQTFAIDAAVLKRNFFLKKLDLGFMLQNMGPDIFYMDRSNPDPIPFTLRLGFAYRAIQTPVHDMKLLLDLNREFVKNNSEGKPDPFYKALFTDLKNEKIDSTLTEDFIDKMVETNINLGLEYWYSNFVALRTGFLIDYVGERYEWTLGLGIKYGTLNFDWSYIYSPEGFMKGLLKAFNDDKTGSSGVRNGQWRASFMFLF